MKWRLRSLMTYAALVVWSTCHANAGDMWMRERVAEAVSLAATWGLDDPITIETDTDEIEVPADGHIYIGRRLTQRLMARPDADTLTRFLLMHELRHVYQLRHKMQMTQLAQECDADYFALLQIARFQLSQATVENRDETLATVLEGQRVGLRANLLATTQVAGAHLGDAQRLTVGGFATWRAIHEWLLASGSDKLKAYAELSVRSTAFVEPATEDVNAWTSAFCRAVAGDDAAALHSLVMMPPDSHFVRDSPDSVAFFEYTLKVRNASDQPLAYRTWPVLGLRSKLTPDLSGAAIVSGTRVDMTVPAGGEANANYRVYYPRLQPDGMSTFVWDSSFNPEFTAIALPAGERVEPASCVRSWHEPSDPDMVTFYRFLRRAGGVASRSFEGMVGSPLLAGTGMKGPSTWLSPPPQVLAGSSVIDKMPGGQMVGYLTMVETEDREQAQAVYDRHVQAIKAICGGAGEVISERVDKDGDHWLQLSHLTIFSSAWMLFQTRRDEDDKDAEPVYSVTWWVQAAEAP